MEPIELGKALNIGRATHEGMSGKHNEDYYGFFAWRMQDGRPLYVGVVADGVGGQSAGEIASQLAVKRIGEYIGALSQVNNVLAHLERAILAAHEAVYQYSQEHPETQGMATTMVVAAILGERLYTSTVGDSRVYFLRDGRMRQISVDHTWAQEAIEAGLLTQEQARVHPNRNVIKRYLGSPAEVQVDQRLMWEEGQDMRTARGNQGLVLEPGDTILLCSDGLGDMVEDPAIQQSLHKHYYDLQEAAEELIEKANLGGGKDNITALILQVPGGRLAAAAPLPAMMLPSSPPPATTVRAAVPVLVPPEEAPAGRQGLAIPLLVGAAGLLGIIVLLAVAGVLWAAGRNDNSQPTNTATPTTMATTAPTQPNQSIQNTSESPATAILIMGTDDRLTSVTPGTTATTAGATSPALIPTLRPTATPTRPRPTATRTPTPLPLVTVTPFPTSSGGGDDPPPPPPTDEPTDAPPTPES